MAEPAVEPHFRARPVVRVCLHEAHLYCAGPASIDRSERVRSNFRILLS